MSFTKVEYRGLEVGKVGIKTSGGVIAVGATMLNFVGAGNPLRLVLMEPPLISVSLAVAVVVVVAVRF